MQDFIAGIRTAPQRFVFHGLAFFRVGMMACAARKAMASWPSFVS